jgi:hypothetical protein
MVVVNSNQVKSIDTNKPYIVKFFGCDIIIRSRSDVIMWLRIRDKRRKKNERMENDSRL